MSERNVITTHAVTKKEDSRSIQYDSFTLLVTKFGVFLMIIFLMLAGIIISDQFLTINNIMNIIDAVSLLGIVAVGVSFVVYGGQFGDLSVPAVMAFSGILAVEFIRFGVMASIIAGIIGGLLIGLLNAYVIGKLRANSIIWTFAVNFMMNGLIRWVYRGTQTYPDIQNSETFSKGFVLPYLAKLFPRIKDIDISTKAVEFTNLARTYVFGIPLMVVVMFMLMIIGYLVMARTVYGNQLKLVGASYEVAKMTGVNTPLVVGAAFMISSFTASVGGIFLASLTKVGAYYNGIGYDFNAITAIILGGMSLAGGRGNMGGVLGGVIVIGLISNILTLLGVDTFTQLMIKGAIFILVVAVNAKSLRRLGLDYA